MNPALSRDGAILPSSTPTGVIDLACFPSPEKRLPPFLPKQEAFSSNTPNNDHPPLPGQKLKLAQSTKAQRECDMFAAGIAESEVSPEAEAAIPVAEFAKTPSPQQIPGPLTKYP